MEAPIPEDLRVVGDLFPHRYRSARDDEGFALGHLLPCDSGQWISTVHAFAVAKTLIERIASLEQRVKELEAPLPQDIEQAFAGSTFPAAYPKLVDALNRRVKELEAERDTLRATVERMKGSVTDAWKQGKGDPAIFQDAEGRN